MKLNRGKCVACLIGFVYGVLIVVLIVGLVRSDIQPVQFPEDKANKR
jgi:hypothetical protein